MLAKSLRAPLLAALLVAPGVSSAATTCQNVNGQLEFSLVGCAESAIGLCLEGTLSGGGQLGGTVSGVFLEVVDGAGLTNGSNVASYAANITFTTHSGTATFLDRGILGGPAEPGSFASIAFPAEGTGTGRFEGVSGHLISGGTFVGDTFSGTLSGEICLAR